MTIRPLWAAIAISVTAILLFDMMALVIKHLSDRYGAAELAAWRNFFGLIPIVIVLWLTPAWQRAGRPFLLRQWRLALFRGAVVAGAQVLFYLALERLAFATAATINYSNALFLTALSVPILGTQVGLYRWSAVMIGFVGVVLVMGPGRDSFQLAALLPLGSALGYAIVAVTAKLFDEHVPTPLINLWTAPVSCLTAATLAVTLGELHMPVGQDWLWILAMGCFGGAATILLMIAFRLTEPANLSPFSYLGIVTASLLGWLVYDETPWADLFPGAILIVLGGLIIVWRERQAGS